MNKKNVMSLIFASMILIIAGSYLFMSVDGYVLPGSVSDFKIKSNDSRDLGDKVTGLNESITGVNRDLVNKRAELESVQLTAEKSRELFTKLLEKQTGDSGKWAYHVPSLLIQLERLADIRNVNIAMDYSTFKSDGEYVSDSKKGLKVVNVKVDVYGVYDDVYEYIKSVEGIEFVSVEELSLRRVGDGDLAGTYYMNVYYLGN